MEKLPEVCVKDSKEVALVKAGATREKYIQKVVDKLEAKNVIVDKFGDEHIVDDNTTQLKAAEILSKLHGDSKEVLVDNRTYNTVIQASPAELAAFSEMVADVKAQLATLTASGRQTGVVMSPEGATDAELVT